MTAIRKVVTAGVAALTVAGGLCGGAQPAAAWGRGGWGGPVAAGLLGGLAAGAIIGSATAHPVYGAYGYGPEPVYDPCHRTRRPVYDADGDFAGYRTVRVCD